MSILTPAVLKAYFETGDVPTQTQYEGLIDTLFHNTWYVSDDAAITDHSDAAVVGSIHWCVDQAVAAGGGSVDIPYGSYDINYSIPVTVPIQFRCNGATITQKSWGVPVFEIRSDDVSFLGKLNLTTDAARVLFDAAALAASNNNATVKAEMAGDPKSAGSAIYTRVSDRLYIQDLRVENFIAGVLVSADADGGVDNVDWRIDRLSVQSVDFGIVGNGVSRLSVGTVQAVSLTNEQGVDEHAIYMTVRTVTRSYGFHCDLVTVDGASTAETHAAVSMKWMDNFRINQICGTNIGGIFTALEASGSVGSIDADLSDIANGYTGVLIQNNSDVTIDSLNVTQSASYDAAPAKRVSALAVGANVGSADTAKCVVKKSYFHLTNATPDRAVQVNTNGTLYLHEPIFEYDNAMPAIPANVAAVHVVYASSTLHMTLPTLIGETRLLYQLNGSTVRHLYDPNRMMSGFTADTILQSASSYNTEFAALQLTGTTLADGATEADLRNQNYFITANTTGKTFDQCKYGSNGQRFVLVAGDALTAVEHNADIVLNGKTTLAAGTWTKLDFIWLGGVAYEIGSPLSPLRIGAGAAAAETAILVTDNGSEGLRVRVLDETLTIPSAVASVNLTSTIPAGSVILGCQMNNTSIVTATTATKVGLGESGDPDLYGLSANLSKNTKTDLMAAWAVLGAGAHQLRINACDNAGAAAGTIDSGTVRVRVHYLDLQSLVSAA